MRTWRTNSDAGSGGVTRRGFLVDAGGGISAAAIAHLLGEAGLLAQEGPAGADPQRIFQQAIDAAIREGEVGIQFAVYKAGKLVVDVWGGLADDTTGRKVDADTLFNVFSVTKAITATALHIQADRGLVSYDAPIAQYWPEFAAHGKGKATVRDALSHRTGVPQMPDGVTPAQMADYDWMVARMADMKPLFEPGTTNAYHSYTWGWIVAEVVRRTDPKKRPFREFVQDEIVRPLGIKDLWLGIPAAAEPRVARMTNDQISMADQATLRGRTMPAAGGGHAGGVRAVGRQARVHSRSRRHLHGAEQRAVLRAPGQRRRARRCAPALCGARARLPDAPSGHRQGGRRRGVP